MKVRAPLIVMDQEQLDRQDALIAAVCTSVRAASSPNEREKLVVDAIESPGIYVFSEIIEAATDLSLSKDILDRLNLFAYGSYMDWNANSQTPSLSERAVYKLRQLSLVSLSEGRPVLPYAEVLGALGLTSVRDLEDLVIQSVYDGVIVGKLDQIMQQLEVADVIGRDVRADMIPQIQDKITDWCSASEAALRYLEDTTVLIRQKRQERSQQQHQHYERVLSRLRNVMESSQSRGMEHGST